MPANPLHSPTQGRPQSAAPTNPTNSRHANATNPRHANATNSRQANAMNSRQANAMNPRQVGAVQRHLAPKPPPVYRPNSTPKVLQSKMKEARPETHPKVLAQRGAATKADQSTIQRFASRVVQAKKFYPNLHPGAVESVDPGNVFQLNNFSNQYRLRRKNSHGINVPNQQYNFVRTREGEMLLHARYRHPSIAEGKQVLYAGEVFFNNGQLEWWSNGSGHYQPDAEDAEQASLPMDHFFSYQQIIKGEHKRKKS